MVNPIDPRPAASGRSRGWRPASILLNNLSGGLFQIPFNPLRLHYIILRTKSQNRCDSCTYTYTDFAIEIWGFYRCLTDTLRYHPTSCSRASSLRHPLVSMFTKSEEKWSLLGVFRCFWRVLENYDCQTKFNSSLGMEYNGELNGFSAVKVKLVDSLI